MSDDATIDLPGGEFLMGSAEAERDMQNGRLLLGPRNTLENEGPQHKVEVSAFACMKFPVTRRLYIAVTRDDPNTRYFQYGGHTRDLWLDDPDICPVTFVRWIHAIRFCNALSMAARLVPCYSIHGTVSYEFNYSPGNEPRVEWIRSSNGYRLPTEAEWEYACRAGTTTQWPHGDEPELLSRYAWYQESRLTDFGEWVKKEGNARLHLHAVGRKLPNAWGLYDMIGNISEWCYDEPRDYDEKRVQNPGGDSLSNQRAIRGGPTVLAHSRSAARSSRYVFRPWETLGFRCVRSL